MFFVVNTGISLVSYTFFRLLFNFPNLAMNSIDFVWTTKKTFGYLSICTDREQKQPHNIAQDAQVFYLSKCTTVKKLLPYFHPSPRREKGL